MLQERIESYRKLALDRMRPTEKELRHGLELHENSYVFDSYGFMPLGWGDASRINQLIEENASRDEVRAAMEELSMTECFKDPAQQALLKEVWDAAGVDCTFQNSGEESNDIERLIRRLSNYTSTADRIPFYERAVYPEQLPAIRARGNKALYFTTNGVPVSAKAISAEESLSHIGVFANFGVRMMHMTYNRRNLLGDGCAEEANGGLSHFGKMAVAEMNRCGVIPDVAHSGQKTSLDTALCSKKPVVASHTVAGGLSTHFRRKDDEVVQAIKATGGYVGICAHGWFLQGSMDIVAMLDHIDYIAKKFGVDHVAIGTDHGFGLSSRDNVKTAPGYRKIFEQYWPRPEDVNGDMTMEQYNTMAWTNWPLFTVGLVQRGYTDEEIRKIIGGNVLRVAQESLA